MQWDSSYKATSPLLSPFSRFPVLLENGLVLWSGPQSSNKTVKTELAITEGTVAVCLQTEGQGTERNPVIKMQ